MIRTCFSFLMLCVCLFVASKLIHHSTAAEKQSRVIVPKKVTVTANSSPYITAFELQTSTNVFRDLPALTGNMKSAIQESATRKSDIDLSAETTPIATETTIALDAPESVTADLFGDADLDAETKTSSEVTGDDSILATDVVPPATTVVPESPGVTAPAATTESTTTTQSNPKQIIQLTPEQIELRERIRNVLGYYYNRHENVVEHSPWGVMHVLIAYGVDTEVFGNGRKMNAIGWLCWNGTCRGQQLFYTQGKKIRTQIGPGVQGHEGQFLAMMAQSRVKDTYPMRIDGKDFTIEDLIEHEKITCEAGTELTFKLIGLSHYLDTDASWKAESGERWSISRLIKEELAQPIVGAACGGTHRLTGFTYAVRKREKEGKPIDGQFLRAKKFLEDYFDYTYYLQNQDGSFSTDFFRGRNEFGDINRRIETTGHILEWLVASVNNEQLRDPRVIKAVKYLTNLMMENKEHEWEIGPKGHALHALAIYSERVYQDKPGQRDAVLARGRKTNPENRTTSR